MRLLTHPQDTFRSEWAWQILLAPERVSPIVQSMLQDYIEVRIIQPCMRVAITHVNLPGWLASHVEEYRWCVYTTY